jgi:hypothetical protein
MAPALPVERAETSVGRRFEGRTQNKLICMLDMVLFDAAYKPRGVFDRLEHRLDPPRASASLRYSIEAGASAGIDLVRLKE